MGFMPFYAMEIGTQKTLRTWKQSRIRWLSWNSNTAVHGLYV